MSLLRSAGVVYTNDNFPPLSKFLQTNLPTWHEVIRRILTLVSQQYGKSDTKSVCTQVAKELEEVWVCHTVYTVHRKNINGRITKKYSDFLKLRQSFSNGKVSVKKILQKNENDRSDSEKNRAAKWQCVMVALVCPKIAFFGDSPIFSNFDSISHSVGP